MTTTSPTQLRESGDVTFDPSARAGATLDHILDTELSAQAKKRQSFISVEEGLHGRRVLDQRTGRTKSRVLFVTTDESVLATDSSVQTEYRTLAAYFDEVLVMVLVAREGADTHERITPNMWVYQVHARYWWRLPWAAATHAYAALTFNGAVRPDIVVAKDPFESGL
ncbi:MAG: hypothetical protein KDA17_07990, partial [Candidatus Saccharibacteria bacterium]|nr:hypothetical protein [Candidatus Saccharibacteria bacterium]